MPGQQEIDAALLKELDKTIATIKQIGEALRQLESQLDLIASAPPWYGGVGAGQK